MAISNSTPIVNGLNGALAPVLFKNQNDKTVIANRLATSKPESEAQRANRGRFQQATVFAKTAMQDARKKAYYSDRAKMLNLPNAYTAAVTDFLRKPEIMDVNLSQYDVRDGGRVTIMAGKKGFGLDSVEVGLRGIDGGMLAVVKARPLNLKTGEWVAKLDGSYTAVEEVVVTVKDLTGKQTTHAQRVNNHESAYLGQLVTAGYMA